MNKRKNLIKLSDVARKLAISKRHLETRIMFEPDFPKRIRLHEKGDIYFIEYEIDEYIESKKIG